MGATGLARLGPFFAVEEVDDGPWRPLDDLLSGPALAERVAWTGEALSARAGVDVEERVAASTASLGIFARLLSPAIGAALLGVKAPEPRSRKMHILERIGLGGTPEREGQIVYWDKRPLE